MSREKILDFFEFMDLFVTSILAPCTYNGIGREFKGGHCSVAHGEKVYTCGAIHVNSAESYFALLKRGVHGIFHHVSKQHLLRYCDEFSFRWSNRKITDGKRTVNAIKGIECKRLKFKSMIL